jgi:hypothetical protein
MTDDISVPTKLLDQWLREPEYVNSPSKVTLITMTTQRLQFLVGKAAAWGRNSNTPTKEGG